MITLDAAIEDYLHLIVRTRPWTKKHDEAVLTDFSDWLHEHYGRDVTLAALRPEDATRYVEANALSATDQAELFKTLGLLYLWATQQGLVENNPYVELVAI